MRSIYFLFSVFLATAAHCAETEIEIPRPAVIAVTDSDQIQRMTEADLILDHPGPGRIDGYLTQDQFDWIRAQGWSVEWVPEEELPRWTEPKGPPGPLVTPLEFYPTHTQIGADLQDLVTRFPNLCRVESIGQSVNGLDLWFLKITDNPDVEENEPEFKYISTMHGNETVGLAMSINLIHLLLETYATDARIKDLVDNTEIWIMPLMNPDGYNFPNGSRVRTNANGRDLNRSFPDPVTSPNNTTAGRQPEVAAVMNFAASHSSVLSANFHTGTLVVNYPFDIQTFPPTPDDDVFIDISRAYADANPPLSVSAHHPSFNNGIVRGALWYVVHGGMQDWNYLWHGCNEVTLEISVAFDPAPSTLLGFWDDNRESMLTYMEKVHIGVHGLVTDAGTGAPLAATVRVVGRDHDVFTDPDVGDYHRMLLPGSYDLEFSAEEYQTKTRPVVISDKSATLNVQLEREKEPTSMWLLR